MWRVIFSLLAVCYTLEQLRHAECRVACVRSGYDWGFFQNEKCHCADQKDYKNITGTRGVSLPVSTQKEKKETKDNKTSWLLTD
jgi:hypothetical protein